MPIDKSSMDACMSDFKDEFPKGRKKKKKKMSKKDINAQRWAACNSMVNEETVTKLTKEFADFIDKIAR